MSFRRLGESGLSNADGRRIGVGMVTLMPVEVDIAIQELEAACRVA